MAAIGAAARGLSQVRLGREWLDGTSLAAIGGTVGGQLLEVKGQIMFLDITLEPRSALAHLL